MRVHLPMFTLSPAKIKAVFWTLFLFLFIITKVNSAAVSEATDLGLRGSTRRRMSLTPAREGENPGDPPDMKAAISSLITSRRDYNERMSEGDRGKPGKNHPKGRGRKRDQRAG